VLEGAREAAAEQAVTDCLKRIATDRAGAGVDGQNRLFEQIFMDLDAPL
jgi:hypothetical protein